MLAKKFSRNFEKTPPKNALPFQTSEGVNSNPDMNYLRIIESEDLHMKEKEFKNVRWGDIYYCDLGVTNGSVQSGMRPVLVVQTNRLNESSPTVVVAAISYFSSFSNLMKFGRAVPSGLCVTFTST